MGEIADMIIDGGMCEWCGACFRQDHGYPVVCWDCWKDATNEERKGHKEHYRKMDKCWN